MEDPGMIPEPELADVMENIERHYIAAREAEEQYNKEYELECAYAEKQRYNWELGVAKA